MGNVADGHPGFNQPFAWVPKMSTSSNGVLRAPFRRARGGFSMPRAIWSGSVSFGLVNVPVKLYSAVHHQDLSFHQFQEGTNARIRNQRVSEKTGREVDYDDIVKGYEVSKDKYVMVDPDELAQFNPRATRTIDIEDFVALEDIDPIYYDATYYLAPDDSEGA